MKTRIILDISTASGSSTFWRDVDGYFPPYEYFDYDDSAGFPISARLSMSTASLTGAVVQYHAFVGSYDLERLCAELPEKGWERG